VKTQQFGILLYAWRTVKAKQFGILLCPWRTVKTQQFDILLYSWKPWKTKQIFALQYPWIPWKTKKFYILQYPWRAGNTKLFSQLSKWFRREMNPLRYALSVTCTCCEFQSKFLPSIGEIVYKHMDTISTGVPRPIRVLSLLQ
jgi:hypothetical protein